MTPWLWGLLGLLSLSTAINYIDRLALSVLIADVRAELGIGPSAYGTISTLFMLAYAVSQLVSGLMIDRIGSRAGFVVCVSLWSLAGIGHALVKNVAGLAVVRVLLGLGEGGNWPAGTKAISEHMPKDRRAFAMGVFDGGSAAGAIVAPPLVAFLGLRFGWRTAFIVTGLMGFVWLAAWVLHSRPPSKVPAESRRSLPPFSSVLRLPNTWVLLMTPVWWFYVFWLPDYLGRERGFGLREIGMFAWIPFLVVDAGKIVGGLLSDAALRRGCPPLLARKAVMGLGAALMMAGTLVVRSASAAEALMFVSVATFGFGVWSPNVFAIFSDLYDTRVMARAIGLTGLGASLGGAFFTWLTGVLVQNYGYGPAFLIAGLAAPAAFGCLMLVRTPGKGVAQ